MGFKELLEGKKTHIIVVATICYALGGAVAGLLDIQTAIMLILGALGFSGLRHGIGNSFTNEIPQTQTAAQT